MKKVFFVLYLNQKPKPFFSESELCTHVRIIRVNMTIGKLPNATMLLPNVTIQLPGKFHSVISHAYKQEMNNKHGGKKRLKKICSVKKDKT